MGRASTFTRIGLIGLLLAGGSLASCDQSGDQGGPGPGPGIADSPGVLPATTIPLSTQRVSSLPPTETNQDSYTSVISRDGLFVAFSSDATNLVGGDTNAQQDIFVTDVTTGATTRASVDSLGGQSNSYSYSPVLSGDGRFVAFTSNASNLVAGDGNGTDDAFVRDTQLNTTVRISVDDGGNQGFGWSYVIGMSDDGRFVAFYTSSDLVVGDTNGTYDIYVHDRDTNTDTNFDEPGFISTTRVSVHTNGAEADNSCFGSGPHAMSSDGRFVVFYSYASTIVDNDTNGWPDAFVHDRQTGETTRLSVDAAGVESNFYTFSAAISGDGLQVMFYSYADNLVPGDTNGDNDVFVRSRTDPSTIRRVSVTTADAQVPNGGFGWSMSTSGRHVVYYSYSANLVPGDFGFPLDCFIRDRDTDTDGLFDEPGFVATTKVSVDTFLNPGNSDSYEPIISGDGTRIVFHSYSNNLVLGDSNFRSDVFMRDLATGTTRRISQGLQPGGNSTSSDPSVDASGLIIAFTSSANNLVPGDTNLASDVFVRDVTGGPCIRVSVSSTGVEGNSFSQRPSQSANGRFVAFDSSATNFVPDGNGNLDVFVRDLAFGLTTRVSVDSNGVESVGGFCARPSISADGRFVSFDGPVTNLVPGDTNGQVDVFVHDRLTKVTTRVSVDSLGAQGNGASFNSSISADGAFVAFVSAANNLVPGDTNGLQDVFVHERATGITTRVSVDSAGVEGNGNSGTGGTISMSSDGRIVVFDSTANNLVAGDTNVALDVFVHDRSTGVTSVASVDSAGVLGNINSLRPTVSEDGRYVAFDSSSTNLVAGDTNGFFDIFRHDRLTGETIRVNVNNLGAQSAGGSCQIPVISADGRFVAFQCSANNLLAEDTEGFIDIYLRGPMP